MRLPKDTVKNKTPRTMMPVLLAGMLAACILMTCGPGEPATQAESGRPAPRTTDIGETPVSAVTATPPPKNAVQQEQANREVGQATGEPLRRSPEEPKTDPTKVPNEEETPTNGPAPEETPAQDTRHEDQLTTAARVLAAEYFGLSADRQDEVQLEERAPVTWSDGSIGCPRERMFYTQAEVKGYRFTFNHDGRKVNVHTGETERQRAMIPQDCLRYPGNSGRPR